MNRKANLLLLLVLIVAFWQVFFLQNGMKWDFVDAFLPSRYFFSESILNNQFPLWNPYLLYGTPIYADLVSVFNPEFWIIGNMFGYSNITLQYAYLGYIFVAGVSFFYFLKQFNAEHKLSIGLSIAFMLSGFSIGNAQHLAFVSGYALIPFVLACYFKFLNQLNKPNFIRLAIALILMIYCSYPALTIILAYFLLSFFIYHTIVNWADKKYIKNLLLYHFVFVIIVVLSSSVLILAYFQISPFLSRFSGLPLELAQKHPFTFRSVLSFLLPMASGNDVQYFQTDLSMTNAYWGIISLVLFLFTLTQKAKHKISYVILIFGVLSLLAAFGEPFFLRGLLYKFAPFMNMFQYPSLFRAFAIFSFLAFIGINLKLDNLNKVHRKLILLISGLTIFTLLFFIAQANSQIEQFAFFNAEKSFVEELFISTRFDNIIFQGILQIIILLVFVLIIWKIKTIRNFSTALLFLFAVDGIVATQLNLHYTVIDETNPIAFSNYLKSSPKGFPIPDLNPIGENSDKKAQNEFLWMNNNVFPKKVTFDGQVAFKSDGYTLLADNHPDLLEAIKKEAVVYLSDDIRENTSIENFNTNTIFLAPPDYQDFRNKNFHSNKNDKLSISDFSPQKIVIKTTTSSSQLLVYQQNYYTGWKVFVDEKEQNLLKSNFTHLAVEVPPGEHTVLFKYSNPSIKYTFLFSAFVLIVLLVLSFYFYIRQHPDKKKQILFILVFSIIIFGVFSGFNRYFYWKNKTGLTPLIIEKTEKWENKYNNNIRILLSTHSEKLKNSVPADTICFIDEKTNISELSHFLMHSDSKYFVFAWQGAIISDDLFELIFSFYPGLIEQEKNHNSGVILVEKNGKDQKYIVSRNFEPQGYPGWEKDRGRFKKDSVSGNHTYTYNNNDKYGTTILIPVEKELLNLEKVTILTDFLMEEKTGDIQLVFTTERDGKTNLRQSTTINKFAKNLNQWSRAVLCVDLKSDIQEGDVIKIYLWNGNKARFQIDDFKVKCSYAE